LPPTAHTIEDEPGLESLRDRWDALAVAAGQPYSLSAWLLAWWRHARPADASLRVIVVEDGDELIGLAPFYTHSRLVDRGLYRLMADRLAPPAAPLAKPGRELDVARAIAGELNAQRPVARVVRLDGRRTDEDWVERLRDAWPGGRRPWAFRRSAVTMGFIRFEGADYAAWLQSKSSKVRQEIRRRRRRFEEAGATFSVAGMDDLEQGLAGFLKVHESRWEGRGGSNAMVTGIEAMLLDAGRELIPGGHFRLYMAEAGGEVVSAHILLAAGGEVIGWAGGFDERWGPYAPSHQVMFYAIEDGFERGDRRLCLGPGEQDYKRRLADEEIVVDGAMLVPHRPDYLLSRARIAPRQAAAAIGARMSPEAKRRVRRLRRR
jgi:CelD/BcsL family acetyltransferase involved in cellulose biosynthesis